MNITKQDVINYLQSCNSEQVSDIIKEVNPLSEYVDEERVVSGKFSFNVRSSYDAMKFDLLKEAFNDLTLDEITLRLKK